MNEGMRALIKGWDGESIVTQYDHATGSWIYIAIHDDTLGIPVGGTRMMTYASHDAGLNDVMRLAQGMTSKWAAIDVPFGGGKAVISLARPLDGERRDGLLRRYARLVDSLHGGFATGEDIGTTPRDMRLLAEETEWVYGRDLETGAVHDPGPYTALGVLESIRAAIAHIEPGSDLAGHSVLVQGVGDVGAPLVRQLAEVGARVLVADLDEERARSQAESVSGTVIAETDVYATECDVYAPCAVGATLNADTIPDLRCRIVAGAANNQLAGPDDAERLRDRGVLYAPDYVANAGGAALFGALAGGETDRQRLREGVRRIGAIITEILREADERNESPRNAAERRVARALERGRAARGR